MKQLTEAEYNEMRKAQLKLQALMNGGVDNWHWYDDAMEEYENLLAAEGLE